MVRIRSARADEARLLGELAFRSKAYWGYDEAFMTACRDELTIPSGEITRRRTVVAEAGGQVLGFATLEGSPPEGALGMLVVDPSAIGRGVGRRLFGHASYPPP